MAEIILQGISHSYQAPRRAVAAGEAASNYALRDIDLKWRDGGAYALLGPSGCGKTTLLGIISGLIQPTRGQVRYGGKDVTELSSRERNIAQVFQFPVVYDTMTVRENLAFPLRNRGLGEAKIKQRVEHIAESLELAPMLERRATRLTADEKQILSLGRGLVREDVAAILFDEPLTVIDPHRKWMLRRKLKEIHRQFHHTLIYVTHDQTEALTFAEEVVVMSTGEVLQRGTPEELFLRPAHTYVGYFIGSPGMNVLPCELVDGAAQVKVAGQATPVAVPEPLARAARAGTGKLELGIRPEHIRVLPPGEAADADGLPLAISAVEDHGRFRIIAGKLGEHAIKVRVTESAEAAAASDAPSKHPALIAGGTARVRLSAEHLCLYRDSRIVSADGQEARS
jgi:glycerol transport system ATP-binding protein